MRSWFYRCCRARGKATAAVSTCASLVLPRDTGIRTQLFANIGPTIMQSYLGISESFLQLRCRLCAAWKLRQHVPLQITRQHCLALVKYAPSHLRGAAYYMLVMASTASTAKAHHGARAAACCLRAAGPLEPPHTRLAKYEV